jgi:hypothetical protein
MASHRGEPGGQDPVTATDVENALASARSQELNDGRAEVGDETRVAGVAFGVPGLRLRHETITSVFVCGAR